MIQVQKGGKSFIEMETAQVKSSHGKREREWPEMKLEEQQRPTHKIPCKFRICVFP